MTYFKVVWYIDWFIIVVALYFLITGISTATQGSNFGKTWFLLMLFLFGIQIGSYVLHNQGYTKAANLIASIPAGLGLGYVLFMLLILITNPRWN